MAIEVNVAAYKHVTTQKVTNNHIYVSCKLKGNERFRDMVSPPNIWSLEIPKRNGDQFCLCFHSLVTASPTSSTRLVTWSPLNRRKEKWRHLLERQGRILQTSTTDADQAKTIATTKTIRIRQTMRIKVRQILRHSQIYRNNDDNWMINWTILLMSETITTKLDTLLDYY